jgi:hypothetical protein
MGFNGPVWTHLAPALIGVTVALVGDLGAGDLLDCADQLPNRTRRRWRARLHLDDRLARRVLRSVPVWLGREFNRLVHRGIADHGRGSGGPHGIVGGAAIIHTSGVSVRFDPVRYVTPNALEPRHRSALPLPRAVARLAT